MKMNKISCVVLVFLLLLWISVCVEARKNDIRKTEFDRVEKYSPADYMSTFDVVSFGAKGNGVFDDSKHGKLPAKLIDGSVVAPSEASCWPKSSLLEWINFKWVQNFTLKGSGIVDAQGSDWWTSSSQFYHLQPHAVPSSLGTTSQEPSLKTHGSAHNLERAGQLIAHLPENAMIDILLPIPPENDLALRFYSCKNVTVKDIRIKNSPLCHLKFDSSKGIIVNNITISSPENSPNTDGIHLQNSVDVQIQYSDIGSGDDCVSIQTGCSNVHVHHLNCGPGHGTSIGGLGKDTSVACVSNIVVEDISMQNTLYGARIKTWQGGIGMVKNVSFSRIEVHEVKVPIVIDQYYCDKRSCKNQTASVVISGVSAGIKKAILQAVNLTAPISRIRPNTIGIMSCVAPPPRFPHPAATPLAEPTTGEENIELIQN
ncbi:polygalacturonase [Senna tora]|uniref:Polygalacturonase n=1 Tax=Senna tora TaxID=362788 RepID=A0A834STT3_9FABA|nr:polygalacturonase [Senna tora]